MCRLTSLNCFFSSDFDRKCSRKGPIALRGIFLLIQLDAFDNFFVIIYVFELFLLILVRIAQESAQ